MVRCEQRDPNGGHYCSLKSEHPGEHRAFGHSWATPVLGGAKKRVRKPKEVPA